MNKAMKLQLQKNANVSATIIENFIDEDSFKSFLPTKKRHIRNHFVFVGTLSNKGKTHFCFCGRLVHLMIEE